MNEKCRREINLVQAITYPFRRTNWVSTLLIPGSLLTVLLCSLYSAVGSALTEMKIIALDVLCFCLVMAIPLGYLWRLINVLHTSGYDAAAPDWTAELSLAALFDGLKVSILITAFLLAVLLPDSLSAFGPPKPPPPPEYKPVHTGYPALDAYANSHFKTSPGDQFSSFSTMPQEVEKEYQEWMNSPEVTAYVAKRVDELPEDKKKEALENRIIAKIVYQPPLTPTLVEKHEMFSPQIVICFRSLLAILFAPFVMAAIVQSAETRKILRLLNFVRTWRAGVRCYGKSLLSLLVSAPMFAALYGWAAVLSDHKSNDLFVTSGLLFFPGIAVITISAHLLAQAFDSYRRQSSTVDAPEEVASEPGPEVGTVGSIGRALKKRSGQ